MCFHELNHKLLAAPRRAAPLRCMCVFTLRRGCKAARLLGLQIRILLGAWMPVCCKRCVLSSRGLCDGPIPCSEQSYQLWCVIVSDLETSSIRRPWPALGCCARNKRLRWNNFCIAPHLINEKHKKGNEAFKAMQRKWLRMWVTNVSVRYGRRNLILPASYATYRRVNYFDVSVATIKRMRWEGKHINTYGSLRTPSKHRHWKLERNKN
jgi:hypothetical protein